MWVSRKDWQELHKTVQLHSKQLAEHHARYVLTDSFNDLYKKGRAVKEVEFVVESEKYCIGYPGLVVPARVTTIDKVLRMLLGHLGLTVEWREEMEGSAVLKKAKK